MTRLSRLLAGTQFKLGYEYCLAHLSNMWHINVFEKVAPHSMTGVEGQPIHSPADPALLWISSKFWRKGFALLRAMERFLGRKKQGASLGCFLTGAL